MSPVVCKYKTSLLILISLLLAGCAMKPKPMSTGDHHRRAQEDLSRIYAYQEPIKGPISLSEAMARAIKYNLDNRLKLAESILSGNELHLSAYDMLPDLAAQAGFIGRSNKYVSFSEDPNTGIVSNNSSSSQDQHRRVANLQATWNVLDFGVSYIAAKQKSDAFLIANERRRKMMQNIIRDVRYAYWRAVSSQKLLRQLKPLERQVNQALAQSRTAEKEKLQPSLQTMQYQKSLLETQREIAQLERDILNAKIELGALMNVPPGTDFTLVEPKTTKAPLPKRFPEKVKLLEQIALIDRPELREEDYRTRIADNEVTKARLRMLPGIEAAGGWNYDSNSFLLNKTWANYGLQLTWNLLRLVSAPAAIKTAKSAKEVADFRRMALSVAIITQVDIAYLRYNQSKKELSIARKLKDVDYRIYTQVRKEKTANKATQLQLIRARMNLLLAELRYNVFYAEWQNAGGQLMSSVGYDPIYHINLNANIDTIASTLKGHLAQAHVVVPSLNKSNQAGTSQHQHQYEPAAAKGKIHSVPTVQ